MPATESESQEQTLERLGLEPESLPRHIAVIMDGNGRWAQQRGLPRIEGHRRGVGSVRRTVEECCRLGIGQLTLYCLSQENWKRPRLELDLLMELLRRYLIDERDTIMKNNVRLQVIGRREGLPPEVIDEMNRTLEMSRDNDGMVLCLAINYGGRAEIVDAVRELSRRARDGQLDPEDVDETIIAEALYTRDMPDPDLLIRTAGEQRVSNFLLWQISYAEIWVASVCWPEFAEEHLQQSLVDFARRERRYGGLNG
ncbi:Decaprenyl diphosphate synthase-like protein [Planctomycetes bacterium Pan216]|uniref:Isoprenyl transferase n=1 Tax=Kolteria novifilia TaxID=2527975 RepID=A0A518B891_9BACT|nr:Decaprenyl diphosphate synthase-like protein [Planctomycetes bacterium Pan216]